MKFKIFLDEAGRGPLAGPVVVGNMVAYDKFDTSFLTDSKKLSEKKRELAFEKIKQLEKEKKLIFSFGFASAQEIDNLGIVKALNIASKRSLLALFLKHINLSFSEIIVENGIFQGDKILEIQKLKKQLKQVLEKPENIYNVDFKEIIESFNKITKIFGIIFDGNTDFGLSKDLGFKVINVIKGDQKVPYIGGASIVAKVIRDNFMKKISSQYPEYKFDKHKGYGTALHRKIIKEQGISPIHRKSFLKNILG